MNQYSSGDNQFVSFMKHERFADGFSNGLYVSETENSLNVSQVDGKLFAISNTDYGINIMGITDSIGGISKVENTDSTVILMVNRSSVVKFVGDAMVGFYSDAQKWRIDSMGVITPGSLDSVTIWALAPAAGSFVYCNNCQDSGGDTGSLVKYNGVAWKKID